MIEKHSSHILLYNKAVIFLCLVLSLLIFPVGLYAQSVTPLQQTRHTSIRGLSVVNNTIAWVSGSNGTVGISTTGGKTWEWMQIKGFEKADFRDIEAFSGKEAIIMSSGTPALILKTIDGGVNWKLNYQNNDKAYFLDAMDFTGNKHGFIMGDPIDGHFLLLETKNAGDTWEVVSNPPAALKGEAAFAASGTCICINNNDLFIVTGGSNSRLLSSPVNQIEWIVKPLPLTDGTASRGAFSFTKGKNQTVIVGGDYAKNTKADSVAYVIPAKRSNDQRNLPITGPAGYQSCVEYLGDNTYISTGTSGSNLTIDGGVSWFKIDTTSYNVCRKAKHGTLVLLAGDGGKIGIYTP